MTQVGVGTNATEDPIPPSFKLDLTLFRWVFGAPAGAVAYFTFLTTPPVVSIQTTI